MNTTNRFRFRLVALSLAAIIAGASLASAQSMFGFGTGEEEQPSVLPPTKAERKQQKQQEEQKQKEEEQNRQAHEAKKKTEQTTLTALDRVINRRVYRLGPGDEMVLSVWGAANESYDLTVTPEGDLLVPSVGPVRVAGLTIDEGQDSVIAASREAYRNARLTLNLVELRKFRVHVSGLVKYPGTYIATPADRIGSLIEDAGGFSDSASTRRIRVIRSDGHIVNADLAMFRATGDTSLDPVAEMGDAVIVPKRGDSVGVFGAVRLPGNYEYRPGDSVSSLIRLAGGLTEDARLDHAEWTTFPIDSGNPVVHVVDLRKIFDTPADKELRAGDQILIHNIPDWRQRSSVTVLGEVRYPGVYSIVEGQTRLSDVIQRAGGFTAEAAPEISDVLRQKVARMPDPELERLSQMSVNEMKPQEYAYFKARTREQRGRVSVDIAEAMAHPGSFDDVLLVDQDVIDIAHRRVTVEVAGQVNRPGLVEVQPGKTVDFYIAQAGGYSWHARKGGIRLIKANSGVWVKPHGDTVVEPGDTIFVPEREPVDWWKRVSEVVGLAAQLATTIFLIQSLK